MTTRQRILILSTIAMFALLVCAPSAFATGMEVDLSATGLTLTEVDPGEYEITWIAGIHALGEDDFSMTVVIEHWRNGTLLETVSNETYDIDPFAECLLASPPSCNSQCTMDFGHVTVFGSCQLWGYDCYCKGHSSGPSLFDLLIEAALGDTVKMVVSPAPGATDLDLTNNERTAEIQ